MLQKILIANRGEIACRVMRTARKLGISTVAVFSDADVNALHVQMADEAVHIGGSSPADSYLVMEKIIQAAIKTGSDGIHPGYGFLSENAAFSELCAKNNILFIGPPTHAIEAMGSKSAAKQIMDEAGVPLLPGYHGDDQAPEKLKAAASEIGYPVLLKAVSGGGGKGMRQVSDPNDFDEALQAAKREALSSFGDDSMLVEKFLEEPRHVEVQVFCDTLGNGVYLFERDCSVQRRHQKILEEAPAPGLSDEIRQKMGEAALKAASAVQYVGAGTIEFLLNKNGDFYFMEMNTRLQVEHPVTELITGQDLVEWQIIVANGEALPCSQSELQITGHAIEARIYAEDPGNEFLPAAGKLTWLEQPAESNYVRVDTGVVEGDEVGVFYDPMIAKLIVWDHDRKRALQRLERALRAYRIVGVKTNIDFLRRVTLHPAFVSEALSTDFIARNQETLFQADSQNIDTLAVIAGLYLTLSRQVQPAANTDRTSPWHLLDYWRMNAPARHTEVLTIGDKDYEVQIEQSSSDHYLISLGDTAFSVTGTLSGNELVINIDGHRQKALVLRQEHSQAITIFSDLETATFVPKIDDIGEASELTNGLGFKAPMNGTVVEILVKTGETVAAGDILVIMEAMKMEHAIKAPTDGVVSEIFYTQGDLVDGGVDLLTFEAKGEA